MNNKGLNNGLLAGLVGIIILLIAYFVDMGFYMNYAGYVVYVAYLYFMYSAAKQTREEQGGFISFGKLLGPVFLTFVIAALLVAVFQYVMYNFIDTSLIDALYDQAVLQVERMSGLLGEEGVEAALDKLEEDGVSYNIGTVVLGYGISLIIPGFIFALIIAGILKKEDKSGV
jgi:hypothetical protein